MASNFSGRSEVVWKPGQFLNLLDNEVSKNLTRAGLLMVRDIKAHFDTAVKRNQGRNSKGQFKKAGTGTVQGRSAPGEIPYVETASLKRSVTRERSMGQERVGTNLPYGRYLETGTINMAARPWLRPALIRNRRKIAKIISRGFNR